MILPRVVRSGETPKYSCAQPFAILHAPAGLAGVARQRGLPSAWGVSGNCHCCGDYRGAQPAAVLLTRYPKGSAASPCPAIQQLGPSRTHLGPCDTGTCALISQYARQ